MENPVVHVQVHGGIFIKIFAWPYLFKSSLHINFDFWTVWSDQHIFSHTIKSVSSVIKSVYVRISKYSGYNNKSIFIFVRDIK